MSKKRINTKRKVATLALTKTCTDCTIEKHLSEFSPQKENSDGFKGTCKSCNAIRASIRRSNPKVRKRDIDYKNNLREETKAWLIDLKMHSGCVECGYAERHEALCLHHVVGPKKTLKGFHSGVSIKTMKAELDKCIVLCRNCHSILHADECAEGGVLTRSRL